ncbi:hypothetical protein C0992_003099 [Termitomyces sp. T32_za158]|nr:hypothetical protein C0992_003099 [Termitomyces sp. T32_za158]
MSFETFVEIYPFGYPCSEDFTPQESEDTFEIWDELLQISKRVQIEKEEWQSLECLDLPKHKTTEEWLEAAITSGRTGKSAEELTALVARLTKISEDFETVMERLKRVMRNPNKKAQLRRTLSGVFPFAEGEESVATLANTDNDVS